METIMEIRMEEEEEPLLPLAICPHFGLRFGIPLVKHFTTGNG
jgi:hypothetical protein